MIVLAVLLLVVVGLSVLFVAVTGSTATVDLVWDAAHVSWAPTALAVFLLGAAVMLLTETAVNLLIRGSRGPRRHDVGARRGSSRHTAQRRSGETTGTAALSVDRPSSTGSVPDELSQGIPAQGSDDGWLSHRPQLFAPPATGHGGEGGAFPPSTRSGRRAAH